MIKVTVNKKQYDTGRNKDGKIQAGWFESMRYEDGVSVAQVAAWNEYGTGRIPARPFMRPMMHQNAQQIREILKQQYRQALINNRPTILVLEKVGTDVVSRIQRSILAVQSPRNAPSTIRAKGFDRPLYDTGTMLNSVDYKVSEENK